jgi:DNA-binding SARP family transcriptional activator
LRGKVEAADPDLDADLAAWWDPYCPLPRLTLLGPMRLRAHGDEQAAAKRPGFYTEIVAYLNSRPYGATAEQVAEALWPDDPNPARVRRAVHAARAWLGTNPRTGRPHLPNAQDTEPGRAVAAYRVEDLLVDADLFRRLRARGEARAQDGIADLTAALELISGPPLDQRRPGGYSWLADHPLDHIYTAMICDVAHLVATRSLADGDPDRARTAAHAALQVDAGDDIALADLAMAADAQGKHAEATAYIRRLLTNHDAELPEDLPPRTYEIIQRRQWAV